MFVVQAIDNGNPVKIGVGNITVTVVDVNEAPSFPSSQSSTWTVVENCAAGTQVASMFATDPDAVDIGKLRYSWANPVNDVAGIPVFAIDASSGVMSTLGTVDFEHQSAYDVIYVRSL